MFMSRWLSFGHLLLLSQIIFTLRSCVIPGLSWNLLRQRLQHRALAASQPCTGKCALTLQPTAAFHHRHPRLDRGSRRAFGRARGEPFGRSSPQRPAAGGRIFRRRCQDQIVTPQHHVPVSAVSRHFKAVLLIPNMDARCNFLFISNILLYQ